MAKTTIRYLIVFRTRRQRQVCHMLSLLYYLRIHCGISFAHAFELRWRGIISEGRVLVSEKEIVRQ
jgi:hypothetical protein